MRNIKHILQSIKDYKGFKTNAALADYLGVSRSTLSNWVARETIDASLIASKIPEIRMEFLLRGEQPMTEQTDIVSILMRRIDHLEKKIAELESSIKKGEE